MVVANCDTPPPTSSTCTPLAMAPASTNPFSTVRRPTTPFMEKVSPGLTSVPRTRSAMRWMLVFRAAQHG